MDDSIWSVVFLVWSLVGWVSCRFVMEECSGFGVRYFWWNNDGCFIGFMGWCWLVVGGCLDEWYVWFCVGDGEVIGRNLGCVVVGLCLWYVCWVVRCFFCRWCLCLVVVVLGVYCVEFVWCLVVVWYVVCSVLGSYWSNGLVCCIIGVVFWLVLGCLVGFGISCVFGWLMLVIWYWFGWRFVVCLCVFLVFFFLWWWMLVWWENK